MWKPFQVFRRILNDFSSITNFRPFNADFGRWNRYKSIPARSGEYSIRSCVVILFFAKKAITKTDRCAGTLSWRRNQLLVFYFSGRFLPDRNHEATKDISVHFFIHSRNSCKLYQGISGTVWSYYLLYLVCRIKTQICHVDCKELTLPLPF